MNIFTNDDYRRIQAWLKANAIKDSDFAVSEDIVPNEDILVITQNMSTVPTNYRIRIKDLLNSSLAKIVIDSITAKSVKVNNVLTVDAANVKLDNEKGTTLQDVLNYFEENKLNRHTDDVFDGNLTIKKDLTIEGHIKSDDRLTTVEENFKATGEITDGQENMLSDVNSAAKGWKIEYQDPQQDEPTVRAKYVLKDYKGVPKGNVIKVYKDSAITNVYLGTIEDTCNPDTGEVTKKPIHDNNEALSIVYRLDTGKYMLVNVPIGIFTREAEFDKYRGLGIEPNGQVFIKLASDVESTNYLHFNSLGELAADGIEDRILRDLGTLISSVAGDGTMWGTYKKHEGTREVSTPNDGSRWGEYKEAEAHRDALSNSNNIVYHEEWDDSEGPEWEDPVATEASIAYNWKTTDTPTSDGKTEGNLKDLYQKSLDVDEKVTELENKIINLYSINGEATTIGQYIYLPSQKGIFKVLTYPINNLSCLEKINTCILCKYIDRFFVLDENDNLMSLNDNIVVLHSIDGTSSKVGEFVFIPTYKGVYEVIKYPVSSVNDIRQISNTSLFVYNNEIYVLDNGELTNTTSALQTVVEDIKNSLNTVEQDISLLKNQFAEMVDIESSIEKAAISSSSGKVVAYNPSILRLYKVEPNCRYIFKALTHQSTNIVIGYLKDAIIEINQLPHYCESFSKPEIFLPNDFGVIITPSDCNYIAINYSSILSYFILQKYSTSDYTYGIENVDISNSIKVGKYLASSGSIWKENTSNDCILFNVKRGEKYRISSTLDSAYRLVSKEGVDGEAVDSTTDYISIKANTPVEVYVPEYSYLYVLKKLGSNDLGISIGRLQSRTLWMIDTLVHDVYVAPHDACQADRMKADFICDGVDDQDEINMAISILKYGGTLHLLNGNFYLDTAKITESNSKYFVFFGYNEGIARTINVEGSIENKAYNSRYGVTIHVNTNNITSMVHRAFGGSSKRPDIEGKFYRFTWVNNVNFKNFYLYFKSTDKRLVGLDCSKFGSSYIEQVGVYYEDYFNCRFKDLKLPTPNNYCIGIITNSGSNDEMARCGLNTVNCGGLYIGIKINGTDHITAIACIVARCVYGYFFQNGSQKPITMIECSDEGNRHLPYFGGSGRITAIDFNIERGNADVYPDDPDGNTEFYATEQTPNSWVGSWSYTLQGTSGSSESGVSAQHFWKRDGSGNGIRTRNHNADHTGTRVPNAPEYLEMYFDLDNNVWKTWNGSNWV